MPAAQSANVYFDSEPVSRGIADLAGFLPGVLRSPRRGEGAGRLGPINGGPARDAVRGPGERGR